MADAPTGTRIIDSDAVTELVDHEEAIDAVEAAFQAHATGDAQMPAKSYIDIPEENGDFRSMPAAVGEGAGVKWVNVHPDNPERFGLPTVMGLVVYSDPASGYPLAVIDGTNLTRIRTGAAAGVATDHLAREDAETLGLLGAGQQSHTQLAAIAAVRDLSEVVVADLDDEAIERFIEAESDRDLTVRGGSPEEVAGCDVISTTTPSREPILREEWVEPGTHINAMGADAEGKQELATDLLLSADVVIDDWEQCSHSGEINVPTAAGDFERDDVYGLLGDLVDSEQGRPDAEAVTIFDSTGLAIQDTAVGSVVYEAAVADDVGTVTQIVDQ
ncbi:ornithine cyclodeaminase [Natrialba hulunbeirensis JCM 10989]|uniref:Alanine dehydrogenase n=1 Tax=Natrialba hulunbeirensis JCM 10989 TaxID=1227493 RepID=L9ZQZ0_9EURY|nr:hypothetical protein [Natrialba hulunbeirensis]ELY87543.1 ornithine cyclodeaminase [Natrialba hulunbeirensis JCM 10989]